MKPRRRKCRNPDCRDWYMPRTSFQKACSPRCAMAVAKAEQKREQKARDRQTREKLKTRSDWTKEAQRAFNEFIRLRDEHKPCISCGAVNVDHTRGGAWDCGHYLSTGANPELRFCEMNAAKQCKQCNQHLSGNVANFRIGLRERIGDEALDWLEGPHEPKRYTIDDLREIRDHYRAEVRRMKREAA